MRKITILKTTAGITASFLACLAIAVSCAGRSVAGDRDKKDVGGDKIKSLIKKIDKINERAPSAFKAGFVVEGRVGKNKKFKTMGEMVHSASMKKTRITFIDSVFKSPMTVVLQEDRSLKFYMPVEKKLYLDNSDLIDLKSYVDVPVDYRFISSLAIGKIPLIAGYTVKQGIAQTGPEIGSGGDYFIILENLNQYQTISLKDDIPIGIMLLHRGTRDKMEFYLENPVKSGNILYYKSIRFISLGTGDRISVKITNIDFNHKINPQKDLLLDVPRNTEIIRIH